MPYIAVPKGAFPKKGETYWFMIGDTPESRRECLEDVFDIGRIPGQPSDYHEAEIAEEDIERDEMNPDYHGVYQKNYIHYEVRGKINSLVAVPGTLIIR